MGLTREDRADKAVDIGPEWELAIDSALCSSTGKNQSFFGLLSSVNYSWVVFVVPLYDIVYFCGAEWQSTLKVDFSGEYPSFAGD